MREVHSSKKFERDLKRIAKRKKDKTKLDTAIRYLIHSIPLPAHYSDHALKGNFLDYRDLHIEPDWLLIYKTTLSDLLLERTGSHSDIFGK